MPIKCDSGKLRKQFSDFSSVVYVDGVAWQAHHIIPCEFYDSRPELFSELEKLDFDINSSQFGVPLGATATDAQLTGSSFHLSSHDEYTREISTKLNDIIKQHGDDHASILRDFKKLASSYQKAMSPNLRIEHDQNGNLKTLDFNPKTPFVSLVHLRDDDPNLVALADAEGLTPAAYRARANRELSTSELLDGFPPARFDAGIVYKGRDGLDQSGSGIGEKAANSLTLASIAKLAGDYLGVNGFPSTSQLKTFINKSNLKSFVSSSFIDELAADFLKDAAIAAVASLFGPIGMARNAFSIYQNVDAIDAALQLAEIAWPKVAALQNINNGISAVKSW